jgi:hypothetical protein
MGAKKEGKKGVSGKFVDEGRGYEARPVDIPSYKKKQARVELTTRDTPLEIPKATNPSSEKIAKTEYESFILGYIGDYLIGNIEVTVRINLKSGNPIIKRTGAEHWWYIPHRQLLEPIEFFRTIKGNAGLLQMSLLTDLKRVLAKEIEDELARRKSLLAASP